MMENQINLISELIKTPLGIFALLISTIIRLCVFVIFVAILINFGEAKNRGKVKSEKKSIVETGTMILFFLGFYWLIESGFGTIKTNNISSQIFLMIFGTLVIVFGTIFNILGRLALGANWANQIKIYQNHTLIQKGVYKIVRHPLYASLIWIFFGASIVYRNYLAFLANLFIFIPFMTYRARQEEDMLVKQFPEYIKYKQKVGMFFIKLNGGKK